MQCCMQLYFAGILAMIMVRTLRRDIAQYNMCDDLVSSRSPSLHFHLPATFKYCLGGDLEAFSR